MTLDILIAQCDEIITRWENSDKEFDAYPELLLFIAGPCKGEKVKLCGRFGPLCEWVANVTDKRIAAYWDARKVKKFILKHKEEFERQILNQE